MCSKCVSNVTARRRRIVSSIGRASQVSCGGCGLGRSRVVTILNPLVFSVDYEYESYRKLELNSQLFMMRQLNPSELFLGFIVCRRHSTFETSLRCTGLRINVYAMATINTRQPIPEEFCELRITSCHKQHRCCCSRLYDFRY